LPTGFAPAPPLAEAEQPRSLNRVCLDRTLEMPPIGGRRARDPMVSRLALVLAPEYEDVWTRAAPEESAGRSRLL
jgi:hypothetical protein